MVNYDFEYDIARMKERDRIAKRRAAQYKHAMIGLLVVGVIVLILIFAR
jgi:hypothetical protein